jgi:hypothetical protein
MQPLSSSAALVHAFRRTRNFLFKHFAWPAFLRLTLAAVLSESVFVNFRFLTPHLDLGDVPGLPPNFRNASGFVLLVIIAALAAVNIVLLAWWGIVRLRFTIFHALLYDSRTLTDGWQRYRKPADRLFLACLLTSLAIVVLFGLVLVAVVVVVFGVVTLKTPDDKFDPGVFLTLFFPTLAFAVSVVAMSVVARIVLHDFILPHMALESATLSEGWRAVRKRIRADRESFFSYFLLRVLMAIVVWPIITVITFLVLWPLFWILGASAAGYNSLLDDTTGMSGVAHIALNLTLLMLGGALGAAGSAILGGPFAVFLRAHALYFYGSRYRVLGELLEQPVALMTGSRSS